MDYLLGFIACGVVTFLLLVISFLCAIKCRIRKFTNGLYWIHGYSQRINATYTMNKYQLPIMLFRIATCWVRSYPSIYIIGEMKCGTTALNEYLNQHQLIKSSKQFVKEPHFFEGRSLFRDNFEDCHWLYKSFFDWSWNNSPYQIDSTPQKLYSHWILKKIKQFSPNAKIIICIREPISRAISNYVMLVNRKKETREINNLLQNQLDVKPMQNTSESISMCIQGNDFIFPLLDFPYLLRGKYINGIKVCNELFGKNMYIMKQETLWQDPNSVMDDICNFLGIPPLESIKIIEKNKGNKDNIPLDLTDEIKVGLKLYFLESNAELYEKYNISFD